MLAADSALLLACLGHVHCNFSQEALRIFPVCVGVRSCAPAAKETPIPLLKFDRGGIKAFVRIPSVSYLARASKKASQGFIFRTIQTSAVTFVGLLILIWDMVRALVWPHKGIRHHHKPE